VLGLSDKALLGQPAADGPVSSVHVFDDAAALMCDSSVPALLAIHLPPVALHRPPPPP